MLGLGVDFCEGVFQGALVAGGVEPQEFLTLACALSVCAW